MSEPISVILVGIGGYGEVYLSALLAAKAEGILRLDAVADPEPTRCRHLDELHARGIPVFESFEDVPDREGERLTVVSSSIHTHCELTCQALSRGHHVLCEKPAAATVAEVDRMIEASHRSGRFVAIGFQWSFSTPILALKRDLRAGQYGEPRRLKSLTLWPRDEDYYRRNDWAGRLRHAGGAWVLDSPANNAMAHDLHNMLFLLGPDDDRSARPVEVQAETYRAFDIETFDTAAIRVRTEEGTELLFLASHAVEEDRHPTFVIECADAVIRYDGEMSPIVAELSDGTTREYASPWSEDQIRKLWVCADAVALDAPIPCGLEAARSHTLVVNGIHEATECRPFPPSLLRPDGGRIGVAGLAADLRRCFDEHRLPGELGFAWSRPADRFDLRGYGGLVTS